MRRKRTVATAAVAATSVLLAGCGSGEGNTPGGATSATVVASAGTASGLTPTPGPADLAARAQAVLDDRLPADGPGCSAALADQGQVAWTGTRGLADLTTAAPITAASVFDVGSVSKQFTATVLLLLVQDGVLGLDDTLAAHLSGFPAWAGTVNLRELMHHRSGIPTYIPIFDAQGLSRTDAVDQDRTLDALRAVTELDFTPGSRWEYSDSNYVLLAEVIETATGQALPDLIQDRLAGPLGLSLVLDTDADVPGKVTGYQAETSGWSPIVENWTEYGDGGIQATPSDLVRWMDNYRSGAVGGTELISAQFDDVVETDVTGSRYGGGVFINAEDFLGHPGAWLGFVAAVGLSPDRQRAVAVTCNDDSIQVGQLMKGLSDIWSPA